MHVRQKVSLENCASSRQAPCRIRLSGTLFKRSSVGNPRNRSGLGLGLYITHQISLGHGGTLNDACQTPEVVFILSVPLKS
jgi:nitrogen-specific signal transduction histidine kinase